MTDATFMFKMRQLRQGGVDSTHGETHFEKEDCIKHPKYKHLFFREDGTPIYRRPCVRLVRALYGHPDAGGMWERHCEAHLKKVGFVAI